MQRYEEESKHNLWDEALTVVGRCTDCTRTAYELCTDTALSLRTGEQRNSAPIRLVLVQTVLAFSLKTDG